MFHDNLCVMAEDIPMIPRVKILSRIGAWSMGKVEYMPKI